MTTKEESIKEKIIMSTLECIEREGVHSITIRKIASIAGVNVAAINYYFSSKELLLKETMSFSLHSAFRDWENSLKNETDLRAILNFITTDCLEGALRYPGVTKAHFYDSYIKGEYSGEMITRLNNFLADFRDKVLAFLPEKKKEIVDIEIVQFFSAIFFPSLFPGLFAGFTEKDFSEAEFRNKYVQRLIENVLSHF